MINSSQWRTSLTMTRTKRAFLVLLVLGGIWIWGMKGPQSHFFPKVKENVMPSQSSTCKENTNRFPSQYEGPVCIEDNICKDKPNDIFYRYKRKPDFIHRVDATIRQGINITHSSNVVPNLVHFIQFTDTAENKTVNEFQFHHMVSVLSAYEIQKPDKIYFWLDREPISKYWERLKKIVPMYLIVREKPTSIRGRKIHFVTKISNIVRMEVIIEYGGMYFDLDVIVVKPLDPLRKYDVTMGKESDKAFCNAIIIAKPWASFLRKWHQEHKTLNENIWGYHSCLLPYILSTQFPSLVHVENSSFFRPSPTEMDDLFNEGQLYDWRKKNYCIHLWIRKLSEKRRTDSEIDNWNTTVGEVFRYILYNDWRLKH